MFCTNCGASLKEGMKYCYCCGEKVVIPEEEKKKDCFESECWSRILDDLHDMDDIWGFDDKEADQNSGMEESEPDNAVCDRGKTFEDLFIQYVGMILEFERTGNYDKNTLKIKCKEMESAAGFNIQYLKVADGINPWKNMFSNQELQVIQKVAFFTEYARVKKMGEIYNIVQFLSIMNEHGWAEAAYYLGKCYGTGLIGYREDESGTSFLDSGEVRRVPFVLKPDSKRMVELYKKAADQNHGKAALELGTFYMSVKNYTEAERYLKKAWDNGEQEAEIYINYIRNYAWTESPYECCNIFAKNQYDRNYGSGRLGTNCIEYKGWMYFITRLVKNNRGMRETDSTAVSLYRTEISSGKREKLLDFNANSYNRPRSSAADIQMFSIANDKIYVPIGNPDSILSINLDGTNPVYVRNLKGDNNASYSNPFAFESFMIYQKGKGTLYKYDYRSGMSQELCRFRGNITGISEDEILFDNNTIFNVKTLQKCKVEKIYPGLKGKEIVLIDCIRKIAYYWDYTDLKKRIAGIDKSGNIVDIWNMPRLPGIFAEQEYEYETQCFNGRRWTAKNLPRYSNSSNNIDQSMGEERKFYIAGRKENSSAGFPTINPNILSFDRSGNIRIVFEKNKEENDDGIYFGTFHAMTDNMILILKKRINEKGSKEFWNFALPMDYSGKFIPVDFYCG